MFHNSIKKWSFLQLNILHFKESFFQFSDTTVSWLCGFWVSWPQSRLFELAHDWGCLSRSKHVFVASCILNFQWYLNEKSSLIAENDFLSIDSSPTLLPYSEFCPVGSDHFLIAWPFKIFLFSSLCLNCYNQGLHENEGQFFVRIWRIFSH